VRLKSLDGRPKVDQPVAFVGAETEIGGGHKSLGLPQKIVD
jgi:hypothetical protein